MRYTVNIPYITLYIDTLFNNKSIDDLFHYYHLSRKTIHLLKQYKDYTLNREYVTSNTILHIGDVLTVKAYSHNDGMYPPLKQKLNIAYEDDILLIVNKPPYIAVYPDDPNKCNSLSNIVANDYLEKHLDLPVRYIHRLDNDTSGLVVFVKCSFFLPYLDDALANKDIHRYYKAVVTGNIKENKTYTIHKAIAKDRHNAKRMIIHPTGKDAITHYTCLHNYKNYALVECKLETGRKHQIRVHMASSGHALAGDPLYSKDTSMKRQALHAYCIEMVHPVTQEPLHVECDLPDDIKKLLKSLS